MPYPKPRLRAGLRRSGAPFVLVHASNRTRTCSFVRAIVRAMRVRSPQSGYRRGVRDGLHSLLRFGSHRSSPVRVYRVVGSVATDRRERLRDSERVGRDVAETYRELASR